MANRIGKDGWPQKSFSHAKPIVVVMLTVLAAIVIIFTNSFRVRFLLYSISPMSGAVGKVHKTKEQSGIAVKKWKCRCGFANRLANDLNVR